MTIACEDSFYVLRYNRGAYSQFVEAGGQVGEEGVEEALEFVTEIPEKYVALFILVSDKRPCIRD